jgi:hypothetical protein
MVIPIPNPANHWYPESLEFGVVDETVHRRPAPTAVKTGGGKTIKGLIMTDV